MLILSTQQQWAPSGMKSAKLQMTRAAGSLYGVCTVIFGLEILDYSRGNSNTRKVNCIVNEIYGDIRQNIHIYICPHFFP